MPTIEAERGLIAWMVRHRVAPNLLMLVLIFGGLIAATRMRQEVFPEFELDFITVAVPYPGASPEEVEQGIVLVIEEAVRALTGAKEITAIAAEGLGSVTIELEEDADGERLFQDVQQAVARVRTFPVDAEAPQIGLSVRRRDVMDLQIYGDVEERVLLDLAEQVRDRLLQEEDISQVDLVGARASEIHVEIGLDDLRRYDLTLSEVARRLASTALDVPGGSLETTGGEVLVRLTERRNWAREFAEIPAITTPTGAVRRLGEIARVSEGFEDASRFGSFDGQPAIGLKVFRVGDQTPERVSRATRRALAEFEALLPPGVHTAIEDDNSTAYVQRRDLLVKNLLLGLLLVLGVLGLFLEPRLAFWVTLGIPTSFLGAFLVLPWLGVSINMISMFAFLIALGIVVDDAIVAGENVHEYRERGVEPVLAAIRGARDVSIPIAGSILTNLLAFAPIAFVPGVFGKIWIAIPLVVGTVFLISWIESLLILPAHLAHARPTRPGALARGRERFQRRFSRFVEQRYAPLLARAIDRRLLTVAIGVGLLIVVIAYPLSGRMGIVFMPKIESDRAVATARLPYGSPRTEVEAVRRRLLDGALEVAREAGGDTLVTGTFALVEENSVEVNVYLTPPGVRPLSTAEVTRRWRAAVGPLSGVESLRFESDAGGPGRGAGLTLELSHRDVEILDRASQRLAGAIEQFPQSSDVDDGYSPGKSQLDLRLRPEARSLGLTSSEVARQVRDAFHGAEALRQQRGREEVKVLVRLPEGERESLVDIERLLIRTPGGRRVPLLEIADVRPGRAYTQIQRRNGRRIVRVTAEITPAEQTNQILAALRADVLPALQSEFQGLSVGFEGRQAEMRESMGALASGFGLALIAIYAVLTIPFRSYVQPAIVMLAIPFGVVGGVLGHFLMGYSLSMISLMGMIALAGVVVNDSLVMIDYANRRRSEGLGAREAIEQAGIRRFRPIVLTTLTTFGGLAPMIFETSRQARFMIPMAISLGYGILFATFITLLLVPALYVCLDDVQRFAWRRRTPIATAAAPSRPDA
ncbi:MAG: efflux RND transporter permease subunit [Myxococcota bacterium]